jgi:hypothetical protein
MAKLSLARRRFLKELAATKSCCIKGPKAWWMKQCGCCDPANNSDLRLLEVSIRVDATETRESRTAQSRPLGVAQRFRSAKLSPHLCLLRLATSAGPC